MYFCPPQGTTKWLFTRNTRIVLKWDVKDSLVNNFIAYRDVLFPLHKNVTFSNYHEEQRPTVSWKMQLRLILRLSL